MYQERASQSQPATQPRIAVVIPCYNEEATVANVVRAFGATLPEADIYVFDNNSDDRTRDEALAAGAIVRAERRQGKGNVVLRMFADVDADVYVMVDGDATYEASAARAMIAKLVDDHLDMVVGSRVSEVQGAYRPGHRFGNALFTGFLGWMFGRAFTDILSGYRVFSRRFVKTFPSLPSGFEIETELAVHALTLRMPVGEIATRYSERPDGSVSKLSTYGDGWNILMTMLRLLRRERPSLFYGTIALLLAALSVILAVPIAITFAETGLVPRFPTAVLCTGLMILAMLSLASGLILDTVTHGRREMRRLAYLRWNSAGG
jgi:glycosyltransferase involved in cell wall biosynthesis